MPQPRRPPSNPSRSEPAHRSRLLVSAGSPTEVELPGGVGGLPIMDGYGIREVDTSSLGSFGLRPPGVR